MPSSAVRTCGRDPRGRHVARMFYRLVNVQAAQRSLELSKTRYEGGVANYLEVITAQNAALSDEVTAVNILGRRMASAVFLIEGPWRWMGPSGPPATARMLREIVIPVKRHGFKL